MRETFTREFKDTFTKGFNHYIEGNWSKAVTILKEVHPLHPHGVDGPSNTILATIERYGGSAPSNWIGHREFVD